MSNEAKKALRCSFCGKPEQQANRMIQGPGVQICDECVRLCMSILDDGYDETHGGQVDDLPASLPVPREIKDITSNGWLVHSFKGDVPTRATEEWGREMLSAVADYIADFAAEFEKTALPAVQA